MSFLDQMKLQLLFELTFILRLAFGLKGQWNITVPSSINATWDSNVAIQCTFAYPEDYYTDNVQVYWKKNVASNITLNDNDKNAFIYHTNDTFVLEEYRKRVKLIGDKSKGNCSMMILNVRESVDDIYLRIIVNGEQYSFKNNLVSISVQAANEPCNETCVLLLVSTIVPASALLIIFIVTGVFCYRKYIKSRSFTREESGYYANFSRTPSNQPQSEASSKTHDNTKYPEPKAIDEPVYVNTEDVTGEANQSLDQRENIYGNVDYSQ